MTELKRTNESNEQKRLACLHFADIFFRMGVTCIIISGAILFSFVFSVILTSIVIVLMFSAIILSLFFVLLNEQFISFFNSITSEGFSTIAEARVFLTSYVLPLMVYVGIAGVLLSIAINIVIDKRRILNWKHITALILGAVVFVMYLIAKYGIE